MDNRSRVSRSDRPPALRTCGNLAAYSLPNMDGLQISNRQRQQAVSTISINPQDSASNVSSRHASSLGGRSADPRAVHQYLTAQTARIPASARPVALAPPIQAPARALTNVSRRSEYPGGTQLPPADNQAVQMLDQQPLRPMRSEVSRRSERTSASRRGPPPTVNAGVMVPFQPGGALIPIPRAESEAPVRAPSDVAHAAPVAGSGPSLRPPQPGHRIKTQRCCHECDLSSRHSPHINTRGHIILGEEVPGFGRFRLPLSPVALTELPQRGLDILYRALSRTSGRDVFFATPGMADALEHALILPGELDNYIDMRSRSLEIVEAEVDRRTQRSDERRRRREAGRDTGPVMRGVPPMGVVEVVNVVDPYVETLYPMDPLTLAMLEDAARYPPGPFYPF